MKGFKRNFKPLELLTDDKLEAIHRGTLRVLAETGLAFHDERALKLFAENGCPVDFEMKRVRIPEWLVEECLAKCPSTFRVRARDSKNDLVISCGDVTYFRPSPGMTTLDLDTWEPREPTRKEFYDYMKVLDALPNVHMLTPFPYFGFAKVPQCMRLVEGNAAKIRNSTKVQIEGSAVVDNNRWNIEMAKATGQDIFNFTNPSPPLTYFENNVSDIYRYTEENVPFHFTSGPVAGSTGPATIAGVSVTNNAESLAGIILAQLIRPGVRVWVANMTFMQNMRTGSPAFGDIGNSLNQVIFSQMWRKYKVPNFSSYSGWSSSKTIDFQVAYEKSMAALISALSGSAVVSLQGGLTGELTAHPVQAILDDDIAGMIGRFLEGVEVSDDTLAVDVIGEVGPIPGHFLSTAHTRAWWKKEQFIPKIEERLPFPEWKKLGKRKAIDRAKERFEEIVSTHKPLPLPPEQEQAIEDILRDAREYYRKKGMISEEDWSIYQKDLNSPNYPYG
ncbi:MAG: trimethylamine methyltransferase family protein [Pseudomonadota bacterium]